MRFLPELEDSKAGYCLLFCVAVISVHPIFAADKPEKEPSKPGPQADQKPSQAPATPASPPQKTQTTSSTTSQKSVWESYEKDQHFYWAIICFILILIDLVLGLCIIKHMKTYSELDCKLEKEKLQVNKTSEDQNDKIDTLEKEKVEVSQSLNNINKEITQKQEDVAKAAESVNKLEEKLSKNATEITNDTENLKKPSLPNIQPQTSKAVSNFVVDYPRTREPFLWTQVKWPGMKDHGAQISMTDILETNLSDTFIENKKRQKKLKNKRYVLKSSPTRIKKPKRQSSGHEASVRRRYNVRVSTSSESSPEDRVGSPKRLNKVSFSHYDVHKNHPPNNERMYTTKKMYLHELLNMLKKTWSKEKVLDKLKPLHLQPYRNKENGQQTNLLLCGLVIKDGQGIPGMQTSPRLENKRHAAGGLELERDTWRPPVNQGEDTISPVTRYSNLSFRDAVK